MNIFRFLGDLSHLVSIFILIHKIQTSRSCRGISYKTQILYLVVFVTRYVDLLTGPHVSWYNTLMKLFFIGSTGYTLYLMNFRFRSVSPPSSVQSSPLWPANGPTRSYLPSDPHMTPHSIHSNSPTSSHPSPSSLSCSTTPTRRSNSLGHSPSGSNQSPFSPSCSCCNGQERQRQSQRTTSLLWGCIGVCISPTGCIGGSASLQRRRLLLLTDINSDIV